MRTTVGIVQETRRKLFRNLRRAGTGGVGRGRQAGGRRELQVAVGSVLVRGILQPQRMVTHALKTPPTDSRNDIGTNVPTPADEAVFLRSSTMNRQP